MSSASNDYGLWSLVLLNSVILVGFAYSFFKPSTLRDWRSFGAYSAFIVALFAEMYGFPLTIFLLSGWLGARFPGVNLFGHEAGHLWWLFTGQHGNPHAGLLHILSFVAIFVGFLLLSKAWHVLYQAQRRHELATAGPYRSIRHPQYVAFVLIMFGFLLQWPTLLTLAMFPVLVFMYVRLAISEEHDSEREFGEAWRGVSMQPRRPASSPLGAAVAIGMSDGPAFLRRVELLSGFGAVILGQGWACLRHCFCSGMPCHCSGNREPQWWDRTLFWACWAILLATLGWVASHFLRRLKLEENEPMLA